MLFPFSSSSLPVTCYNFRIQPEHAVISRCSLSLSVSIVCFRSSNLKAWAKAQRCPGCSALLMYTQVCGHASNNVIMRGHRLLRARLITAEARQEVPRSTLNVSGLLHLGHLTSHLFRLCDLHNQTQPKWRWVFTSSYSLIIISLFSSWLLSFLTYIPFFYLRLLLFFKFFIRYSRPQKHCEPIQHN